MPFSGLNDALKSKKLMITIIWTIVFLCCFLAAVYFIYMTLAEYHSDPTATKVKLIRQAEFPFPPVVLCVDTWLDADKAAEIGLTENGTKYALSFLVAPHEIFRHSHRFNKRINDPLFWAELQTYRQQTPAGNSEFEESYKRKNFTNLMEFFEFISLDALEIPDKNRAVEIDCVGCTNENMKKVILEYDVCYKIEFDSVSVDDRQILSWHELNIRVPDFSHGIQKRKPYWKLYVAPLTAPMVPGKGFVSIQPDHSHIVRVSSEHYISMNKTKEPCVEYKNDTGRPKYSTTGCLLDCLHRLLKEVMNCSVFNLDSNLARNLSEYCNIVNAERWAKDFIHQIITMNESNMIMANNVYETCTSLCLPECESWKYRREVDVHLSQQLQRQSKEDNIRTAKIRFVNGDVMAGGILTYTEVDTYTFDTLVGY